MVAKHVPIAVGVHAVNNLKFYIMEFFVIRYDSPNRDYKFDVIPTFINTWKDKKYNFEKKEVKTKEDLKKWIIKVSSYFFWGKCEWECLLATWPFGSYRQNENLKEFFSKNPNFDISDYKQSTDFRNAIIKDDMVKIDIHEQLMMNIDILTDLLYIELKLDKKKVVK